MPRRKPRVGASDAGSADGLTDAQERFCQEYLLDLNATRAYRAAYPKAKQKSAESCASRLLSNAKVAQRVQRLVEARNARTTVTADDVVRELAAVGMSDVEDLEFAGDGRLVVRRGGNPLARRAVASVKFKRVKMGKGQSVSVLEEAEIRLWNKPEALRMLAQHTGVLREQIDVNHHFVAEVPEKSKSPEEWQRQHAPSK
jgi:phage terminase small subunit